ncbi:hypothetical protein [Endozoicomonas sp.]|uniref:hypothetical protein n=1 Tax=Endozoicomonas sp. TaxID=1892382 RepID=UPI00383B4485
MKKNFIALAIAASLMTGCASTGSSNLTDAEQYAADLEQGKELYSQSIKGSYQPSVVDDVEIVRTAVNAAFLVAKPAYEDYSREVNNYREVQTYLKFIEEADTEEAKKKAFDVLTAEQQQVISGFVNNSKTQEIVKGLGEAAQVALKNIALFKGVDTTALMKQVSFKDMMAEKDKLALTGNQIAYLSNTVVKSYNSYRQIKALVPAQ